MTTGITSILKNILKFITFIGAVVAAVFLLRAFVIEPFVVPTGSMESTIEVGDCILAQKITLETGSDLKSGDIVVFKNPRPRNGVDILVKRVIATSGQTVDLKDGKVYVVRTLETDEGEIVPVCSNCGEPISLTDSFCPHCSAEVVGNEFDC